MSLSRPGLPIIAEMKGSERMNCAVGQTASPPSSHTGCAITLAALLGGCRTKALGRGRDLLLPSTFFLQTAVFTKWAMLGSNQRPLPCEGRSITSWLFAGVHKYLQDAVFSSRRVRVCSLLFAWVGVLLVYMSLIATPVLSRLCGF